MPYPRFRDYVCGGMGRKEDLALIGTHGMLQLELESAEFEDSGDICAKTRSLTIGTPLMPYSAPSFEKEGKVERLIDEYTDRMSLEPSNTKKRSRLEFNPPSEQKPLLCPNDYLESTEVSSATKSKFSKKVLIKATSNPNLG